MLTSRFLPLVSLFLLVAFLVFGCSFLPNDLHRLCRLGVWPGIPPPALTLPPVPFYVALAGTHRIPVWFVILLREACGKCVGVRDACERPVSNGPSKGWAGGRTADGGARGSGAVLAVFSPSFGGKRHAQEDQGTWHCFLIAVVWLACT